MTRLPPWAEWSPAAADRPWTIGLEEEVMLLDPRGWSVANRVDDVLAALPRELADRASAEVHACVIELKSTPSSTVAQASAQIAHLRRTLARTLDGLELCAAAAGTHPLAVGSDVAVSSGARYGAVLATMRALSRREPTMALHVHVAVPDGATAVRALDRLRAELPLLLALSASSPYWRGADSGFSSMRTPIFSAFPRVGIPRRFGSYAAYVGAVETMLRAGAIPEPSFLWWDARLQPRLGTLELRIMDAQSHVADVAAIAAVAQCLVMCRASRESGRVLPDPDVLAENRFLAARDGMAAMLIEPDGGRRPMADAIAELLEECRPAAAALGCASELATAAELAADPGCERQRRVAAREGVARLPAALAHAFAPMPAAAVAA